jgi:hypothetical protein
MQDEKLETDQILVKSDSIIPDEKYLKEYRVYLIQYIAIVFHFDRFVDLKQL